MNKFIKNLTANRVVRFMRKAQAAMEYLITYGWAVLIMLVVVGAMFYLGIFSSPNITTCSFQTPGFACFTNKLSSNSSGRSGLILDLSQTTGHDIRIIGFNCTTSQTWTVTDFDGITAGSVTIPSGSHASVFNGTVTLMPLPCYKNDGSKLGPVDAGSYYRGKIYIHYWDLETNIDHKVTGDIAGSVE